MRILWSMSARLKTKCGKHSTVCWAVEQQHQTSILICCVQQYNFGTWKKHFVLQHVTHLTMTQHVLVFNGVTIRITMCMYNQSCTSHIYCMDAQPCYDTLVTVGEQKEYEVGGKRWRWQCKLCYNNNNSIVRE